MDIWSIFGAKIQIPFIFKIRTCFVDFETLLKSLLIELLECHSFIGFAAALATMYMLVVQNCRL